MRTASATSRSASSSATPSDPADIAKRGSPAGRPSGGAFCLAKRHSSPGNGTATLSAPPLPSCASLSRHAVALPATRSLFLKEVSIRRTASRYAPHAPGRTIGSHRMKYSQRRQMPPNRSTHHAKTPIQTSPNISPASLKAGFNDRHGFRLNADKKLKNISMRLRGGDQRTKLELKAESATARPPIRAPRGDAEQNETVVSEIMAERKPWSKNTLISALSRSYPIDFLPLYLPSVLIHRLKSSQKNASNRTS